MLGEIDRAARRPPLLAELTRLLERLAGIFQRHEGTDRFCHGRVWWKA